MVLGSLMEGLRYRWELFAVEFSEEKRSLLGLLVLAMVAVFALFMAFLCLNILLLLLFQESAKLVAGLLFLVYLACAGTVAFIIFRRLRHAPPPFDATLEVLRKDQELLSRRREGGRNEA